MPPLPARHLQSAPDPLLVVLAAEGDREAFAELVRRRQYGVRRFMRQLCRDAHLADDLAQKVFLRLWRTVHRIANAAAFNGYLKQIMVSVWIDETRSFRSQPAIAGDAQESSTTPMLGLSQDLEWALGQLDPRTRLCVLLCHGEGHSHGEIAELLTLPLGTVKSLLTRGSERLRGLLCAYLPPEQR